MLGRDDVGVEKSAFTKASLVWTRVTGRNGKDAIMRTGLLSQWRVGVKETKNGGNPAIPVDQDAARIMGVPAMPQYSIVLVYHVAQHQRTARQAPRHQLSAWGFEIFRFYISYFRFHKSDFRIQIS